MALRSVVLEPAAGPPAPRRTVVLRQGGPRPKGAVLDVVLGVLGALILVSAAVLAQVLPDRTYLNPQFRVAFVEAGGEFTSQSQEFLDGDAAKDFAYAIPEDNVKSVKLVLGFEDDVTYSLPDMFTLDLIAPNGTVMGHVEMVNPAPRAGSRPVDPPTAQGAELEVVFPTAPATTEQIVTGLTHEETVEQVQARMEPQHRVSTAGTWTVRVTLVAAQDCPGAEGGFPGQGYYCRFGHPSAPGAGTATDGGDPGNRFLVANFSYTYYVVDTQELS